MLLHRSDTRSLASSAHKLRGGRARARVCRIRPHGANGNSQTVMYIYSSEPLQSSSRRPCRGEEKFWGEDIFADINFFFHHLGARGGLEVVDLEINFHSGGLG